MSTQPMERDLGGFFRIVMDEANQFLTDKFVAAFNEEFSVGTGEEGSAFVPLLGVGLEKVMCLKNPRVVGNNNCVSYKER